MIGDTLNREYFGVPTSPEQEEKMAQLLEKTGASSMSFEKNPLTEARRIWAEGKKNNSAKDEQPCGTPTPFDLFQNVDEIGTPGDPHLTRVPKGPSAAILEADFLRNSKQETKK